MTPKFCLTLIFFSCLSFVFSTLCRDGSYCPGYQTCCLTPYGVGCCPYENAVCCGDGYLCCPYGYVCGYQTCYRRSHYSDFLNAEAKPQAINNIKKESQDSKEKTYDLKGEIEYIIQYCLNDKPIDENFKEMLINCKEKTENYNHSENCKFALLHFINEGMITSMECYSRINEILRIL